LKRYLATGRMGAFSQRNCQSGALISRGLRAQNRLAALCPWPSVGSSREALLGRISFDGSSKIMSVRYLLRLAGYFWLTFRSCYNESRQDTKHNSQTRSYYDQLRNKKVVSPEYRGVDLKQEVDNPANPIMGFPGHWAPNDLFFYTGDQFPDRYKNGAFIAFHGSSNRFPYPQSGFFVGFVPFKNGAPSGSWEVFADGFAENETLSSSSAAAHRPMGIAMGPDGSLYVSDIVTGKIWRIMYKENRGTFGKDQLAKMEKRKMLTHLKTPDKVKDNLVKGIADEGKKIYTLYCTSCHQENGKGDGSRYPSLVESDWVSGDKNRLIEIVLNGLKGPIVVNGKTFNGEMPKHDFLSNAEISKVTSYIRLNFKNNAGVIQEKEVAQMRDKLKNKQ
jgi:mono/diheme cytochrome c family protein